MSAPFVADRPDYVFLAVRHTIAGLFPNLDPAEIFGSTRTTAPAARARQIGMHVMCRLGLPQGETARQFGRDRSTVTHAVTVVEGLASGCRRTAAAVDTAERRTRELLDLFAQIESDTTRGWHG